MADRCVCMCVETLILRMACIYEWGMEVETENERELYFLYENLE